MYQNSKFDNLFQEISSGVNSSISKPVKFFIGDYMNLLRSHNPQLDNPFNIPMIVRSSNYITSETEAVELLDFLYSNNIKTIALLSTNNISKELFYLYNNSKYLVNVVSVSKWLDSYRYENVALILEFKRRRVR